MMGKFKEIAFLCRENNMKELEETVAGIAMMMGKEPSLVASEFKIAYDVAEEKKSDPSYKIIYENQKEAAEFYEREYQLTKE
tara:strand:+ start:12219 stop:12464 length:246 start_codon:yes stop_codon:yes gene_type:complete